MRIAFLGLGRMGQLMAGHLLDAGHELRVWNRSPGKAEALTARGATEAPTPAAAAEGVDAVVLMLFDADACRSVLFGDNGVAAGAAPGTLIVDSSTIGPDAAREFAAEAQRRGLRYVDAPVAGSTPVAEKGDLGVLLGGDEADVKEAMAIVAAWGGEGKVRHIGGVGDGQAMKIVVNTTLGYALVGVGEALRLSRSLGLDREQTLAVIGGGPLGAIVAQKKDKLLAEEYGDANFAMNSLAKDLDLADQLTKGAHPGLEAVRTFMQAAIAAGHGDDDIAALAGFIADEGSANSY
ncbi:MAG: 6-phosphogluconate dehydrogenase NAD-binding [Mycobacterium sp.]|nr:6-phosphogluconate dehydrogenase NAD-binding [Mycobacterium sp.]